MFKIFLQCFLIFLLFLITYSRLVQLWDEKTGLTYSMLDDSYGGVLGAELPSFTICSYVYKAGKKPKMDENKVQRKAEPPIINHICFF